MLLRVWPALPASAQKQGLSPEGVIRAKWFLHSLVPFTGVCGDVMGCCGLGIREVGY